MDNNGNESEDMLKERLDIVKLDDETQDESLIRILENYILLIHLIKSYKLILKDARYHRTTTRFEQAFPLAIRKTSGKTNEESMLTLDKLIGESMSNGHVFIRHPRKLPYPVLELDKLLKILETINYDSVLSELIKREVISEDNLSNLDPDTNIGNLTLQIFHATLYLIEKEQRILLDKEEAPYPPKNREQMYSRLKRFIEEEPVTR